MGASPADAQRDAASTMAARPSTVAGADSAACLAGSGSLRAGPDDGADVGPFELAGNDGHDDTPGHPEQQAEGDITEPVHTEYEAGVADQERAQECDEPGPPDPVGQRNGAEHGEEHDRHGDTVAGGERVAGFVHALDGAWCGVVGDQRPVPQDDLADGKDLQLAPRYATMGTSARMERNMKARMALSTTQMTAKGPASR